MPTSCDSANDLHVPMPFCILHSAFNISSPISPPSTASPTTSLLWRCHSPISPTIPLPFLPAFHGKRHSRSGNICGGSVVSYRQADATAGSSAETGHRKSGEWAGTRRLGGIRQTTYYREDLYGKTENGGAGACARKSMGAGGTVSGRAGAGGGKGSLRDVSLRSGGGFFGQRISGSGGGVPRGAAGIGRGGGRTASGDGGGVCPAGGGIHVAGGGRRLLSPGAGRKEGKPAARYRRDDTTTFEDIRVDPEQAVPMERKEKNPPGGGAGSASR